MGAKTKLIQNTSILFSASNSLSCLCIGLLELLVVRFEVDTGQNEQHNQDAGSSEGGEKGIPPKLLH